MLCSFRGLPLELKVGLLHLIQREPQAFAWRRFQSDDSFGDAFQQACPMALAFDRLAQHNLDFLSGEALELLRFRKPSLHARRADLQGIGASRNRVFDIQDCAHVLRDELAVGMANAVRFIDHDAQNPARAAAQELYVHDLHPLAPRHAFRNLPNFLYGRRPVRHAISSGEIKKWAYAHSSVCSQYTPADETTLPHRSGWERAPTQTKPL